MSSSELTRLRAGRKAAPNNPDRTIEDWTNVDELPLAGWVDTQSSDDLAAPTRDQTVTRATLYCTDALADVQRGDRVRYAGGNWSVVGFPDSPRNPYTGWQPYRVVSLELVVG